MFPLALVTGGVFHCVWRNQSIHSLMNPSRPSPFYLLFAADWQDNVHERSARNFSRARLKIRQTPAKHHQGNRTDLNVIEYDDVYEGTLDQKTSIPVFHLSALVWNMSTCSTSNNFRDRDFFQKYQKAALLK